MKNKKGKLNNISQVDRLIMTVKQYEEDGKILERMDA